MNYRGVSVRITLLGAQDHAQGCARLSQALIAAPAGHQPSRIVRAHEHVLIARFRPRLPPAEACVAASDAVTRTGLRAEVCIWVGPPGTTTYGDSIAMSRDALARIASGSKTTAYSSFADYLLDGEEMPAEGDVVTVLDHAGNPALRYRITTSRVMPYARIAAQFVGLTIPAQIAAWEADNKSYFARIGAFDPQMPIVCERFILTAVLAPSLQQRTAPCSARS